VSFDSLLTHRVTIRRMVEPATADAHGNRTLVYDPGLDVTVAARVEPASSTEDIVNRNYEREVFDIFLPASTVVDGVDELGWLDRDVILKVQGEPREAFDSIGVHHLELTAYRTEG
jgi:hypothetical protein